ncbi:hypothetical protein RP20_CCG003337 [Aedes albopictus]|nr:hypothetical protein RP20_CCG003337 [Aedes albopictus]
MKSGGPISWSCRRQSTVALSTTEAEYMAVSAAAQEAIWWRGLRQELSGVSEKITVCCDNKSAIHLAGKEVDYSPRSKHIDIRHHFVREKVEENIIGLAHVGSRQQVADLLTKAVPVPKFEADRRTIGVGRILG